MADSIDLRTGYELDPQQGGGQYKIPPKVQFSLQLLNAYSSARSTWEQQFKEDQDFRAGKQWTEKQEQALIARRQTPFTVNVIHPAVETAKSMLTSNHPRFTATAREDSDTKTARVFTDLLAYVWDMSTGNSELKQTLDDYYVGGMGVMMAYVDSNADFGAGEVFVKSVNPLDVYFDPNSQDVFCRDAAHIIVRKIMTHEQVQSLMPTINLAHAQVTAGQEMTGGRVGFESAELGPTNYKDMTHRKYEVIDRYTKIKLQYTHVTNVMTQDSFLLLQDQYEKFRQDPAVIERTANAARALTRPEDVATAKQMISELGSVFHYRQDQTTGQPIPISGPATPDAIPNSETQLTLTTVGEAIDSGLMTAQTYWETRIERNYSVGGQMIWSGVLPIDEYPIVPFMNRHSRNPYPMSDVRFVRRIQEYINKVRSLIVAHAASSTNVKVILPKGAVDRKEFAREWQKAGTGVLTADYELGEPKIVAPPPLPAELYKNEADAKEDVARIFGVYDFMQGQPSGSPETYRGTVIMDEYGQRRIKSKLDDIEAAMNMLAKVVVELMQVTYTRPKMIRILQPNAETKMININYPVFDDLSQQILKIENDITVGRYDIIVVSGSTLPSNRWARFEFFERLYDRKIIDQVEVLKQTEVTDMESVLQRFGHINMLEQQVQQLAAQVKQLQGDIQTRERELFHTKLALKTEKATRQVDRAANRAEHASTLYNERLNDDLKLKQEAVREAEQQQEDF